MTTVKATYAKQNFGLCLTDAVKHPVVIEKSGRPEEYQRLNELEDTIWLRRAQAAATGGCLSAEDSDDFMRKRLLRVSEEE